MVERRITGRLLFYGIATIGTASLLLQIANAVVLNRFWPFFAAIVVHVLAGAIQFMRMVLLLPDKERPER